MLMCTLHSVYPAVGSRGSHQYVAEPLRASYMLGHVTVFLTMPVEPMLARLKVGLHVGSLIFVVYLRAAVQS